MIMTGICLSDIWISREECIFSWDTKYKLMYKGELITTYFYSPTVEECVIAISNWLKYKNASKTY